MSARLRRVAVAFAAITLLFGLLPTPIPGIWGGLVAHAAPHAAPHVSHISTPPRPHAPKPKQSLLNEEAA